MVVVVVSGDAWHNINISERRSSKPTRPRCVLQLFPHALSCAMHNSQHVDGSRRRAPAVSWGQLRRLCRAPGHRQAP